MQGITAEYVRFKTGRNHKCKMNGVHPTYAVQAVLALLCAVRKIVVFRIFKMKGWKHPAELLNKEAGPIF